MQTCGPTSKPDLRLSAQGSLCDVLAATAPGEHMIGSSLDRPSLGLRDVLTLTQKVPEGTSAPSFQKVPAAIGIRYSK